MTDASNAYVTVAALRDYLGIDNADHDESLAVSLNAACRQIDTFCGQSFTAASNEARSFYPVDQRYVRIDPCYSVDTVKTDTSDDGTFDTTWTSSDYQTEPVNLNRHGYIGAPIVAVRAVETRLFPTAGHRPSVQITGDWGWSAVPSAVYEATLIQAGRLFRRKDSVSGVAGFGEFGPLRVSSIMDPDVQMLVAAYRRPPEVGLL